MPSADLIPHGVPAPETAPDDPRLGRWLAPQSDPKAADVVIVGFPSDEGVRRNGGRPGAASGPRAIREALYRLTPDAAAPEAFAALLERTADVGDIPVTGDVEGDQERLGTVLGPLLQSKKVIVLGGGHETTYGHFLGYVAAGLDVEIINWDAHADVRPVGSTGAHSGSPFRQALEHSSGRCRRYTVAGLQPHSTARAHLDFLRQQGSATYWRHEVDGERVDALADGLSNPALATFDLDAVEAASAPGVSAPNPAGFPVSIWLQAAYRMGKSPSVRSVDVVELNPSYDADGGTARLAALTVWHVLRGMAAR